MKIRRVCDEEVLGGANCVSSTKPIKADFSGTCVGSRLKRRRFGDWAKRAAVGLMFCFGAWARAGRPCFVAGDEEKSEDGHSTGGALFNHVRRAQAAMQS